MSFTVWLLTLVGLLGVLALDFFNAWRNRNVETKVSTATKWTIFYICLAIAFGISLGFWRNSGAQSSFFAGWITEYSLSFDNLFVFILILAKFKISKEREELALLIGIVSSLFLRAIFIGLGSAIVNRWSWVFFIFGGFLIYTAISLIRESEDEEWEENRFLRFLEKRGASAFLVACIALAITNVLFALDSIPAIFGLTRDTYIIITTNIFASFGLRQLYFVISGLMSRLIYLTEGLAILLIFIGIKLILEAAIGQGWEHIGGFKIPEISTHFSLEFILVVLVSTAVISILKSRNNDAKS